MAHPETIYAVPIEAHAAVGVNVAAICWGTCGKGSVGGIGLGDYGSAIPCTVESGACPHFVSEAPGFGTVPLSPDGPDANVTLRRLSMEVRHG